MADVFNNDNQYLVMGGDFNMDASDKTPRTAERHMLLDFENKTLQIIKCPTRSMKKSSSIIDLICVSSCKILSNHGLIT